MSNANDSQTRGQAALAAWRRAIGDEFVLADEATRRDYETATFATTQTVPAILRPRDTAEVRACVRIAGTYGVPLYPISRGQNWGLGSTVPAADGCVVLDLSRLNRIVSFSETDAYLAVEPGVTFQQAYEFLRERGSRLMLCCTGGPPDGSVLANCLERGDGVGPLGNRLESICHLQVILANGDMMRLGPGQWENAGCAHLTRDTPGPALDGLFTQSNLGIVTELTIWLMPAPPFHRVLQCRVGELPGFLDALKGLVLSGAVSAYSAGVWNAYKLVMSTRRYPWKLTGGATPFRMRDHAGQEPWFGSVLLYGPSQEIGQATERFVRETLQPWATSVDSEEGEACSLGVPGMQSIRGVYWRKRGRATEIEPERDRCGVLWLCPALPFRGGDVANLMAELEPIFHEAGFEPSIGLSVASPRHLRAFLMLAYDREIPGEDARAMTCHDQLRTHLEQRGYYPFRQGIQAMDQGPAGSLLAKLKQALDPDGILAPGRYEGK